MFPQSHEGPWIKHLIVLLGEPLTVEGLQSAMTKLKADQHPILCRLANHAGLPVKSPKPFQAALHGWRLD